MTVTKPQRGERFCWCLEKKRKFNVIEIYEAMYVANNKQQFKWDWGSWGEKCQLTWTEIYAKVTLVREALYQAEVFATYCLCKEVKG